MNDLFFFFFLLSRGLASVPYRGRVVKENRGPAGPLAFFSSPEDFHGIEMSPFEASVPSSGRCSASASPPSFLIRIFLEAS